MQPGWYRDAEDEQAQRYWDGERWSAPLSTPGRYEAPALWPSPRAFAAAGLLCLVIGLLGIAAGLAVGLVHVDRQAVDCGSPLGGSNAPTHFAVTDFPIPACNAALADREVASLAVLVPGCVLAGGSLVTLLVVKAKRWAAVGEA